MSWGKLLEFLYHCPSSTFNSEQVAVSKPAMHASTYCSRYSTSHVHVPSV